MADTGRTVWANGLWADGFWAAGLWAADAPVSVPDVDNPGTTQAAAVSAITGAGLVVAIATAYSATVPAGEVISQDPAAGTLVAPGSTVTITVSLGVQVIANDGGGGPDPKHYEWELFIARQAIRLERERREQEKALEKAALVGEQKPQQIEGIKQDSQERLQELAALESLVKKHSEPPEGLATGIREAYISVSRQADSGAVELLMLEIEAQQREEEELLHFAVMLMMH